MRITQLKLESEADGETTISVWMDCHSTNDLDDLTAWLKLVRHIAERWREQRHKKNNPVPKLASSRE